MSSPNGAGPTFWHAPELIDAGFPVFPLKDKEPTVEGGFYAATLDKSQVAQWIEEGRANHDIGIPTGIFSGLVVIDADTAEEFEWMRARYGEPQVLNKRGGHWWFRHPKNGKVLSNKIRTSLDRKADGGLVVVPPSKNRQWRNGMPHLESLPVLPEEFWTKGKRGDSEGERSLGEDPKERAAAIIARYVERIASGEDSPEEGRHEHLRHLCGVLLSRNVPLGDAEDIAVSAWSRVDEDLRERAPHEVSNTLRTTEEAIREGHATGVPSMERVTPGLFAELAEVFEWKQESSVGFVSAPEWGLPENLPSTLGEVDPFNTRMLPHALRGWVHDISNRMQIPPDFCAAGAMVVASALVGRKVGIKPKRHDDWLVIPNLWGAAVGRPAMLKSPALAEVMKPLERLVAEARERHESALEDYSVKKEVYDAEQKALKNKVEKAAKAGNDADAEIAARQKAENKPPEEPTPRRYKTEDPTVEALGQLLVDNPQGLLVHRDELSGWLRSLDKQGREGDRSLYLEAWNGTGSYEVDRIGRGSLYIPALCVSILGGIQPGPLSKYVYEANENGEGSDGLLQRFQLLVWPDPPTSWQAVDHYPDTEAKNRAYGVFKALDALDSMQFGASSDEQDEPASVSFTEDGQEIFDEFRNALENRLRSETLSAPLEAHLAKYRSLFPSLALLFAAVDFVDEGTGAVDEEKALMAWSWCDYLESHANRLYGAAESPELVSARALAAKIREGAVTDGDTLRSIYRRCWTALESHSDVSAAAEVLEAYDWLRVVDQKTGGRPSQVLLLNPNLGNPARGAK